MDQSLSNAMAWEDLASPVKYQQMTTNLVPDVDQVYPIYDSDSSLLTPDSKLVGNNIDDHHQVESASSGGANSSDLSSKERSESCPSLSDSDSESSNSTNAYYSLPINTDKKGMFYQKIAQLGVEEKKATYEELLEKVVMYEDEMKVSNLRLQKSEEEVSWLKNELTKGEETLQSRLESAHREVKDKEAVLEVERRRVLELENKIAEEEVQDQLKLAQDEIEKLKAELSSERKQVTALEEINLSYRSQLSEIPSMAAKQNSLEASIRELETLHASLEHKLTQCEAEKMEMKTSYDAQEFQFRGEISQLKADLNNKGEQVEGLNKSYDTLKHKYDTLVAERDELNAKVDTMRAEVHNQEAQKLEMEQHLRCLNLENGDLIADCGSAKELVAELRLRVGELEKEVDRQNGEILAMAEEKREAIRQLCLSLDHYRSDYKELRDAIVGQKRVRVVA
ncbi:Protein NETWORKED 4B [Linum perenne]